MTRHFVSVGLGPSTSWNPFIFLPLSSILLHEPYVPTKHQPYASALRLHPSSYLEWIISVHANFTLFRNQLRYQLLYVPVNDSLSQKSFSSSEHLESSCNFLWHLLFYIRVIFTYILAALQGYKLLMSYMLPMRNHVF